MPYCVSSELHRGSLVNPKAQVGVSLAPSFVSGRAKETCILCYTRTKCAVGAPNIF